MGIREWRRVVVVQQLIDSHGGSLLSPGNNRNSVVLLLLSATSVVWCLSLLIVLISTGIIWRRDRPLVLRPVVIVFIYYYPVMGIFSDFNGRYWVWWKSLTVVLIWKGKSKEISFDVKRASWMTVYDSWLPIFRWTFHSIEIHEVALIYVYVYGLSFSRLLQTRHYPVEKRTLYLLCLVVVQYSTLKKVSSTL